MVKLAQEALKSPKIREWVSIESTPFRKSIISNHNKLLGKTPEVDGIKTGFTRRAGFNIVATGKNDERRIIVIVLGSPMPIIRDNFAMEKFKEYLLKKEIYLYDVSKEYNEEGN
jgi:D-alanyl-D-alanine carboxypeptidase